MVRKKPTALVVNEGALFTGRKCMERFEKLLTLHKSEQKIYKTGQGTDESITGKIEDQLEKYVALEEDYEVTPFLQVICIIL